MGRLDFTGENCRAGHGCRATNREAVLVTALSTVEGYRTPNEAMVC